MFTLYLYNTTSDGHRSFFSWIGDPDLDPLFILLCDPFPDPDLQFITRSFPDPDPKFLAQSRYYLYIQLIRFYFIIETIYM